MDTRRTKRSVQEIVKVDPEPVEEEDPSFKYLLPELLLQIFEWFKVAHKNEKVRNAELAKLRRVCPQWQNVIDTNFSFEPVISDKVVNGNYHRLLTMKVKKCSVAWLSQPPKRKKIPKFLNPSWIEEVSFGKNVRKDAFLVMCQHFTKSCNVTSVRISDGFHDYDHGRVIATNPKEKKILTDFWKKVKKLDFSVPDIDLIFAGSKRNHMLVQILKTAEMPQLKNVKISGHWRLLISPLPLYFLCRHHSSVERIHLQLEPFLTHQMPQFFLKGADVEVVERLYRDIPNPITINDVENVQVKSFIVEGYTMWYIVRYTWIHLLLRQRKLSELRLCHMCEPSPEDKDVPGLLPFVDLVPVLENNMSTLTRLELFKLHFNEVVDFNLFQGFTNLHTFRLSKNFDGMISKIVNLNSLPSSLTTLTINGFGLSDLQLKQFASCDQMKSLRSLELVSIHHPTCSQPRGIPGEILKDLIGMKSMLFLHLDDFTVSLAHQVESVWCVRRKSYFVVPGGKGPMVRLQNNWTYSDEVAPKYTITCKDTKDCMFCHDWFSYIPMLSDI